MTLPSFIIIGAQKSATTFLHHDLMRHPEIFMPYWEIPYFEDPDYSLQGWDEFKKNFSTNQGKKIIGFKRPDYLSRPECPNRISRSLPDVKLIAILRNPIERAFSAYYHYMAANLIPIKDLNSGMVAIINGEYNSQYPRAKDILEYGFYFSHLNRYLDYFDIGRMFIGLQDDIRNDYLTTLKNILLFLRADENYQSKIGTARPGEVVYPKPRVRLHRWMNNILGYYDRSLNGVVFRKNNRMLRLLAVFVANRVDRLLLSKIYGNPKPQLDPAIKDALIKMYRFDILKLQDFLNRDLGKWLA